MVPTKTGMEVKDAVAEDQRETVLVTGCSTGLGSALCEHLASLRNARGEALYRVYATARKVESLRHLAEKGIETWPLDVRSDESVQACVDRIHKEAGHVDYLVSNAGVTSGMPIVEQSMEQMEALLDTNVLGTARVIKAVTPRMMERKKGTIVTIGSVTGYLTTPYNGIYSGSKACVRKLADTLRMELAPWNINVMHIDMGAFKSSIQNKCISGLVLTPDSKYKPIEDTVLDRFYFSYNSPGVSTPEVVAKQVARQMLKKKPPFRINAAGRPRYYKFVGFLESHVLPGVMFRVLTGIFGIQKLKKIIRKQKN